MKKRIILLGVLIVVLTGAYGGYAWWQADRVPAEPADPAAVFADYMAKTEAALAAADRLEVESTVNYQMSLEDKTGELPWSGLLGNTVSAGIDTVVTLRRADGRFALDFLLDLDRLVALAEQLPDTGASEDDADTPSVYDGLRQPLTARFVIGPAATHFNLPQMLGDRWYHFTFADAATRLGDAVGGLAGQPLSVPISAPLQASEDTFQKLYDPAFHAGLAGVMGESTINLAGQGEDRVENTVLVKYEADIDPAAFVRNLQNYLQETVGGVIDATVSIDELAAELPPIRVNYWFDPGDGLLKQLQYAWEDTMNEEAYALTHQTSVAVRIDYAPAQGVDLPAESTSVFDFNPDDLPEDSLAAQYLAVSAAQVETLAALSRDATRKADLESVRAALELYFADHAKYPPVNRYTKLAEHLRPDYLTGLPQAPTAESNYRYNADTEGLGYVLGTWLERESTFFYLSSADFADWLLADMRGTPVYDYAELPETPLYGSPPLSSPVSAPPAGD